MKSNQLLAKYDLLPSLVEAGRGAPNPEGSEGTGAAAPAQPSDLRKASPSCIDEAGPSGAQSTEAGEDACLRDSSDSSPADDGHRSNVDWEDGDGGIAYRKISI